MTPIEIHIRRAAGLRRICLEAPQRWEELSEEQFRLITSLRRLSEAEYPAGFLASFLGIPRRAACRLNGMQLYALGRRLDFLSDLSAPCPSWLIPSLGGRGVLEAPGKFLAGVTLHQWMSADTMFNRYVAVSSTSPTSPGSPTRRELLSRFAAYIYLPRGIAFPQLTPERYEQSVALIERLCGRESYLPEALALNMVLVRNWLAGSYPHLFPTRSTSPASRTRYKRTEWLELFDHLVGDNLPQIDAYRTMAATDAFRIMNRRIKEHGQRRQKSH